MAFGIAAVVSNVIPILTPSASRYNDGVGRIGAEWGCMSMKHSSTTALIALLIATCGFVSSTQQVTPADLDKILERAESLFQEAKSSYESASSKGAVAARKAQTSRRPHAFAEPIGEIDS